MYSFAGKKLMNINPKLLSKQKKFNCDIDGEKWACSFILESIFMYLLLIRFLMRRKYSKFGQLSSRKSPKTFDGDKDGRNQKKYTKGIFRVSKSRSIFKNSNLWKFEIVKNLMRATKPKCFDPKTISNIWIFLLGCWFMNQSRILQRNEGLNVKMNHYEKNFRCFGKSGHQCAVKIKIFQIE